MRREQGYTLVELVISLAITGVIFTMVGTVLYQINNVSKYGNDRLIAIHEVQNSGYWFNFDGQMALSATDEDSLIFSLPSGQTITYSLDGKDLKRTDGTSSMTLAQNITAIDFSVEGRL